MVQHLSPSSSSKVARLEGGKASGTIIQFQFDFLLGSLQSRLPLLSEVAHKRSHEAFGLGAFVVIKIWVRPKLLDALHRVIWGSFDHQVTDFVYVHGSGQDFDVIWCGSCWWDESWMELVAVKVVGRACAQGCWCGVTLISRGRLDLHNKYVY